MTKDQLAARIERVRARLAWLRDQDGAATVFGAATHGYKANPPLADAALAVFEHTHEVILPNDYRTYLREIGNGGAGPYYGLSKLAPLELDRLPQHYVEIHDGEGNQLAAAGSGPRPLPDVTSSIARPFPLTGEWSPEQGALPVEPGTSPYDGCVHLSDQGCGYFDFLVVRGDAAGQVWSDYTAGSGPIAKSHDSFLDWYEAWLDSAQVEWIEKNARDMALYAPAHYPGLEDCLRLLEQSLERSPKWAEGWRALGYVALNRRSFGDALTAFDRAKGCGKDEPEARLRLDRARLAAFRDDHVSVIEEADAGLAEQGLWASTETELRATRLAALDKLGREDDALAALYELAKDAFFDRRHHFELAVRHLRRDEPDKAWAILEDAVARNVGPSRHDEPATREAVYADLADCLRAADDAALADRVMGHLD